MRRDDELLIQAKASAASPDVPAFRRSAASEARAFREAFDGVGAEGGSRAMGALADLMIALHEFSDPAARVLLAKSIGALADALRAERAAAARRKFDAKGPRLHWTEGERA